MEAGVAEWQTRYTQNNASSGFQSFHCGAQELTRILPVLTGNALQPLLTGLPETSMKVAQKVAHSAVFWPLAQKVAGSGLAGRGCLNSTPTAGDAAVV